MSNALPVEQIALIRSTWTAVEGLGAETVGVLLFKHIFADAPEAAALFRFGREPGFDPNGDLAAIPALVRHATGVVNMVGAAVGLLDDVETLAPVLTKLGAKHVMYGVSEPHYPIVGGAFLKTLSDGLGSAYTDEVATAYTDMWGVVQSTMLSGAEATSAAPVPSAEVMTA